ncbi:predicted protein [Naegleria gruberi]|uniref:Predicted protein n=1 Tax=Naegleria gruberi TaxID=5762 RepID=D2VEU2_NAEGR|nr:uncharacterized protein NAEGRDRAFT_67394 [Naegleria gruberi]EFC44662.1 predicted protein [Naegleria gruberi]|eukprot:XP_002677406.1 predicted protein [Naegleria gruberi strain NEG-M]
MISSTQSEMQPLSSSPILIESSSINSTTITNEPTNSTANTSAQDSNNNTSLSNSHSHQHHQPQHASSSTTTTTADHHNKKNEKGEIIYKEKKKKKFDATHYMALYDELMANLEAREVFSNYLKKACTQEPMLFLNDYGKYSKEYAKYRATTSTSNSSSQQDVSLKACKILFDSVGALIDLYIRPGSERELNLPSSNVVQIWDQEIVPLMQGHLQKQEKQGKKGSETMETKLLERSQSELSESSIESEMSQSTMKSLTDLFEMLNPDVLFEKIIFSVNLDLKIDQFPRFNRSKELFEFLNLQGEAFTRRIAVDISRGFNVDIRYKPKDLTKNYIYDRDIYFGLSLLEDSPDWQAMKNSKSSSKAQMFHSKTSYVFDSGRKNGLKLFKIVTLLPYPVEDVWKVFKHVQAYDLKGTEVTGIETLGYHEPGTLGNPKASQSALAYFTADEDDDESKLTNPLVVRYCTTCLNLGPTFKKRQFPHTQSTVFDEVLEGYINVGHTAPLAFHPVPKERVMVDIFFVYFMYRVGKNSTRFGHIIYSDVHLPDWLDKLVANPTWKKRCLSMEETILKVLKEKTANGTRPIGENELTDEYSYQKQVEDNRKKYPHRSWYKDYLSMFHKEDKH